MADAKITALTAITTPDSADILPIIDTSDVSDSAQGSSRKITYANLITGLLTASSSNTLTNKSIDLASNTLTGTLAQFNTALSGADFATLAGSETLTNKTLTSPIISTISNTGTLTLPTSTDTLVGKATTDTLTNKTLTSPAMTTPSVTSGDMNLATGLNIQVNSADPKRGIYVPAAGMYPATTNGADPGQYESATNKINVKVLDFDGTTEQYAWFCMPAPSYWDLGTVTAEFHWTFASGSGDVIWGIAGLARSNDDAIDSALGTAVTVTDTCLTALDEHLSADTSAITIGGTPAKDDFLFIRVYRDADAGGDTLNGVDARLLGVTLRFSRSQYDDI